MRRHRRERQPARVRWPDRAPAAPAPRPCPTEPARGQAGCPQCPIPLALEAGAKARHVARADAHVHIIGKAFPAGRLRFAQLDPALFCALGPVRQGVCAPFGQDDDGRPLITARGHDLVQFVALGLVWRGQDQQAGRIERAVIAVERYAITFLFQQMGQRGIAVQPLGRSMAAAVIGVAGLAGADEIQRREKCDGAEQDQRQHHLWVERLGRLPAHAPSPGWPGAWSSA